MQFKITKIYTQPNKSYHNEGCLLLDVEFKCDKNDLSWFGDLNKYSKAIVIPDVNALESYEDNLPKELFEVTPIEGTDYSDVKIKGPSCFDLGLRKLEVIEGRYKVYPVNKIEDLYGYREYVADCLIARACIVQIAEMQDEMSRGICSHGDFPEQAGGFRSASAVSDFAGILMCLDNFWD